MPAATSPAAIPPWIAQPADPAAHFAQGYQIGVHTGAQQAAQAFQAQQQALAERRQAMAEQQQAFEDAMNEQVLNLKATETARKFQANQMFRARVAGGEDPSRVLMELAPDLGESAASVLNSQAKRDEAQEMMAYRQANLQRLAQAGQTREQTSQQRLQETIRHDKALEAERQGNVDLQVVEIGGSIGTLNPKTGAFHPLSKSLSEQEFYDRHIGQLLSYGLKPDTARTKVREMFSEYSNLKRSETGKKVMPGVDPGTATPTATSSSLTSAPTTPAITPGTIVKQNGKRYRFDGVNYVEIQ